ncbi:PAS domain-containing protein [Sphingobacterium sp. lm-10]|uniref:PAS domain-containing protein n=1 Tax=Sphingobacterium sp. lm-10 TaxID=2944904 RepID=UPI002021E7FF|nr:PAS domain-containing protein [Sphingobacterium sp. lm-10]MCL7987436.1 PAS domain-containing protein [Sphingobacterium sp. lm-10]
MITPFFSGSNQVLLEILNQSNQATAIYTGPELTIQLANNSMLKFWGKDKSVVGNKFEDALPELHGQPFPSILKEVWNSGTLYAGKQMEAALEINGSLVRSYFDFVYQPIFDKSGNILCILHTAWDVSERVAAWKLVKEKEENEQLINEELEAANEEYRSTNEDLEEANERLNKTHDRLVYTEHRMQQLVSSTPVGLTLLRGPNMIIESANQGVLEIWGHKQEEVIGKPMLEVFPLLKGQVFSVELDKVFSSAEKVSLIEVVDSSRENGSEGRKYLSIDFSPLLDTNGNVDAIMATVRDTTEQVVAKIALEESETQLSEYNEELAVLNEELQTTNEELATINEEYNSTNEQLEDYNQAIQSINNKLTEKNENLNTVNVGYQNENKSLSSDNKSLSKDNKNLRTLNNAVTKLNNKLIDSEAVFKNLIAQSPIAIMLLKGEDLIVTIINSPMLELIDRDDSIIGKSLLEEIPELVGQPAAIKLIQTFRDGSARVEFSSPVSLMRNGDLVEGFYNFSYAPYMEDGHVTGVIDMVVDVTTEIAAIRERDETIREKTLLEDTLRNSEQRLQGILETMAEGVGIIDVNGQLVYANPMAQQILGLTLSEIEDRTYDDPRWQNLRLDGSPLPEEEHPMSIMMSTGRPVFDVEIGLQPPNRDRSYISINAAPIFDDQGNLSGGIGTFMDVTSRRLISQSKDDFISIASHELKTPVTSLKASLQLLERAHKRLPEETREKLISQSIRSLENLSRLISDLLDTSRMEQGQMKIEKKLFSLDELFDDCCSHIAKTSKKKIIFKGEKAQLILADNQQIGQVLINFITNAIKYAPDSVEIIVNARLNSDAEIKISVQDFGPGIEEEKSKHLFNRYYRADYKGQKFTGLGLGLYICAEIIKNHGGTIGVDSVLGEGSEFWFTLPLESSKH